MSRGHYWFARRGRNRNKVAPVSREGWLVTLAFVVALLASGAAFHFVDRAGYPGLGMIVFVGGVIVSALTFIAVAQVNCDPDHSFSDYRAGRVPDASTGKTDHA